jgi:hypothetical protein
LAVTGRFAFNLIMAIVIGGGPVIVISPGRGERFVT